LFYQAINAICETESSQANESTKLNNTIVMQQSAKSKILHYPSFYAAKSKAFMTCKVIHNALVNKVPTLYATGPVRVLCACVVLQTQAICNCRITSRAVIWFTPYFPNLSFFQLTAQGGLPENPGTCSMQQAQYLPLMLNQKP